MSGPVIWSRPFASTFRAALAVAIALLAALLLALAGAPSAGAQLAFIHDDDVWVMNDDGSGARPLVDDTPLGMGSLSDPHPSLDGSSVYFSGQTSLYTSTNPENGRVSSGFWAVGAYRWTVAGPERLSPPPDYCFSYCSTFDSDAAPTATGNYSVVESLYGEGDSESRLSVGAPSATVPTACEPYSAAPDPANGSLFAYVCDEGEPTVRITSGDPASEVVARTTSGVGYVYLLSAPAWRTDGARLALAETSAIAESTQPSRIVTFNPDGSDPRVLVESADPDVTFDSPTFIGSDRIAFTAVQNVPEAESLTDIYTVPASCDSCSFPAAATPLTAGGTSSDPAFTPGVVPTAAPPTPAPAPTKSATPTPSPPLTRPKHPSPIRRAEVLKGKAAPKHGIGLKLTLTAPATVKFEVSPSKKKKPKPLGSLSRKLKKGTSTVKITKVGKKPLQPGRYLVGVRVPGTEGFIKLTAKAR